MGNTLEPQGAEKDGSKEAKKAFAKKRKDADKLAASLLFSQIALAERPGEELAATLDAMVTEFKCGWRPHIAKVLLDMFSATLAPNAGVEMNNAVEHARVAALKRAKEVFVYSEQVVEHRMFVALGMLVILAPPAIEAMGFGDGFRVKGTFGAQWAKDNRTRWPERTLTDYFNRLGMQWKIFDKAYGERGRETHGNERGRENQEGSSTSG